MARPKSTAPKKAHLNLTITEQTKAELNYLSASTGLSISALVAEWASKEANKAAKKAGKPLPDADQLVIE